MFWRVDVETGFDWEESFRSVLVSLEASHGDASGVGRISGARVIIELLDCTSIQCRS